MSLPPVQISLDSFGANDTSYIHLNPDWDTATLGYSSNLPMTPVDIAIGLDEYIFVADIANNKILTINKAGNIETTQNLNNIQPIEKPTGIAIDEKLNLLIVNGSNTIFIWNQYFNNVGIDSVITGINLDTTMIFSANQVLIDSLSGIYSFYTDTDENSNFQDIAFGPSDDNTVFVTDKGNDRILKLTIVISGGVLLKNNYLHPFFTGVYETDIATFGSGAGTVDNPKGITADDDGSIYFTQLGGNFLVQKMKQGGEYIPAFTLYEDAIMDLERFKGPYDIALGPNDEIFVIDTADSGRVSKFYNRGIHAGNQANLGRKGLAEARFNQPHSIAVSDDGIVYIANTGANRIERYQYTISDEDLPEERP